jgi:hypothetical protein
LAKVPANFAEDIFTGETSANFAEAFPLSKTFRKLCGRLFQSGETFRKLARDFTVIYFRDHKNLIKEKAESSIRLKFGFLYNTEGTLNYLS